MTDERLQSITDKAKEAWKVLKTQFNRDNFSPDVEEAILDISKERTNLLAYIRDLQAKIGQLERLANIGAKFEKLFQDISPCPWESITGDPAGATICEELCPFLEICAEVKLPEPPDDRPEVLE